MTKIDICDKNKLEKIRKLVSNINKNIDDVKFGKKNSEEIEPFLRNGIVLVKNRSEKQINAKENLIYSIRKEKDFFRAITQFRTFDLKANFGCECISEKIRKNIYQEISKKIPKIYEENKQRISECQEEIQKFGTDYIYLTSNSDSSKLSYLNSLANHFIDDIYCKFSGKLSTTVTKELMAISSIKKIFYSFLDENRLRSNKQIPSQSLSNEEIINILKRSEGDRLSGFPEGDVIHMVLEKDMKKLKEEVKEFSDGIIDIVQTSIKSCLETHFCRYPEMIDKIEVFLNTFCEKVNLRKLIYH